MRTSCQYLSLCFQCTLQLGKRFVPPWEKDGKSADEFFAGLMQSSNPLTRKRKEEKRWEEYQELNSVASMPPVEIEQRAADIAKHNAEVMEEERKFLPYSATPRKYFDTTGIAAWGEYATTLEQQIQLHKQVNAEIESRTREHSTCSSSSSSSHALSSSSSSCCSHMSTTANLSSNINNNNNNNSNKNYIDEICSVNSPSMSEIALSTYSPETLELLSRDMENKLPYKYTSFVPLPSSGNPQWPLHGTTGVVIDLDGVLYRSKELIPGADTAVQLLHTLKIPFMFLSNGGPLSEAAKAQELSELLSCPILPEQVVLAHSPMRLMAPLYADKPVLIVGPPCCLSIAKQYGFHNAISILDYQSQHPELVPYKKWNHLQVMPPHSMPYPEIAAIFQFNDPDDVFSDIQVMLDILTSPNGQVGRYVSRTQTVPYFVAADDLLWSTRALLPRLGQGAFKEMITSVYESVTGNNLEITMYGKPRRIAFSFAEERLRRICNVFGWPDSNLQSIFMIGDNIETDIIGANAAGGLWTSVHVMTGIGQAMVARRTLSCSDEEHEWLEKCISHSPHYIAPSLDHFLRELLLFPANAMLNSKTCYHGAPNPVDLRKMYNFAT